MKTKFALVPLAASLLALLAPLPPAAAAELRFEDLVNRSAALRNAAAGGVRPVAMPVSLPVAARPPRPSSPAPASAKPKGIAIAGIGADHTGVMMATGGHSQELQDVQALLTGYGQASLDVAEHPEVMIYPGVRYLMPWHEAEKVLVPFNTTMRSGDKIACAGFPDGLTWVRYDGRWNYNNHAFNHLFIVKDIDSQVVALEFLNENDAWAPPVPPWRNLGGNWHVIDYVNAEVKGQGGIRIDTLVLDERQSAHRIVVHTTNGRIRHTAALFLPQPLIDLMLYCTRFNPAK